MKVSIIMCIIQITTSLASPSPQGGKSDPCYCKFPKSNPCKNKIERNGCSGPNGYITTTESAWTSPGN